MLVLARTAAVFVITSEYVLIDGSGCEADFIGKLVRAPDNGAATLITEAAINARGGGVFNIGFQSLRGGCVGVRAAGGWPRDLRGFEFDPGANEGSSPFTALCALAVVRLTVYYQLGVGTWE